MAVSAAQGFGVEIAGRIVEDHSGEPLASARVRVTRPGQARLVADLDTGRDGRFLVPNLPEGEYVIEASKPNFMPVAARTRGTGSATLRLVKFGVISGRVADSQNRPIRSAFLFLPGRSRDGKPLVNYTAATTDARGEFRIHGLPPGKYSVAVSLAALDGGPGAGAVFYPSNANPRFFEVSGGEEYRGVDFIFPQVSGSSIRGRVEVPDDSGTYVLALVSRDEPSLSVAIGETSPDGAFHLEGLPPGSYELFASGPLLAYAGRAAVLGDSPRFGRARVDLAGQDIYGVSIEVAAGHSVRFVLGSDAPLPEGVCPASATLQVAPVDDRAMFYLRGIRVSFDEERSADGIAPGRYQITLGDLGEQCFLAANPIVDLEEEPAEAVRVVVAPAGSIRGRLLPAPAQNTNSVIVLFRPQTPAFAKQASIQAAFPDENGHFEFPELQPGTYRIGTRPLDGEMETRWLPDLAQMVEIEVAGGAITGVELPVGETVGENGRFGGRKP